MQNARVIAHIHGLMVGVLTINYTGSCFKSFKISKPPTDSDSQLALVGQGDQCSSVRARLHVSYV